MFPSSPLIRTLLLVQRMVRLDGVHCTTLTGPKGGWTRGSSLNRSLVGPLLQHHSSKLVFCRAAVVQICIHSTCTHSRTCSSAVRGWQRYSGALEWPQGQQWRLYSCPQHSWLLCWWGRGFRSGPSCWGFTLETNIATNC